MSLLRSNAVLLLQAEVITQQSHEWIKLSHIHDGRSKQRLDTNDGAANCCKISVEWKVPDNQVSMDVVPPMELVDEHVLKRACDVAAIAFSSSGVPLKCTDNDWQHASDHQHLQIQV